MNAPTRTAYTRPSTIQYRIDRQATEITKCFEQDTETARKLVNKVTKYLGQLLFVQDMIDKVELILFTETRCLTVKRIQRLYGAYLLF
jgi:hypothetical protein